MIHGDLKGVRFYGQGFSYFTESIRQGEHTNRPNWKRPTGGLWSADHHLGPREPFILELIRTRRHGPVDESGTYRTGPVWIQGQPSDETFGLLCSWDGHI